MSKSPLIVIIGPTASGKTALAIQLAQQFDGQIVCADSRTVYKGMDIGTAKPSATEQAAVRHYGLDLVSPDQPFTVADFKRYAVSAIDEITGNGHVPVLVGGSGLFVDAVLYDFQFRAPANPALRGELEGLSTDALQARIQDNGWPMPENSLNRRYLIRTIETAGAVSQRRPLRPDTLILGLKPDKDNLEHRLQVRAEQMVVDGLIIEATKLADVYGWDVHALQAPGYHQIADYNSGSLSLEEIPLAIARSHYALAKRQLTWFKRNKSIHWLSNRDNLAEAVALTTTFLDTKS